MSEKPTAAQYIREVYIQLQIMDSILHSATVYGSNRETAFKQMSDPLFKARLYLPAALRELGEELYNEGLCSPRVER